jgi:hypothetical protein
MGRTDYGLVRRAGGGAHPHGVGQGRRLDDTGEHTKKNETVILVIYGCFWLFFIQILVVTHCVQTI